MITIFDVFTKTAQEEIDPFFGITKEEARVLDPAYKKWFYTLTEGLDKSDPGSVGYQQWLRKIFIFSYNLDKAAKRINPNLPIEQSPGQKLREHILVNKFNPAFGAGYPYREIGEFKIAIYDKQFEYGKAIGMDTQAIIDKSLNTYNIYEKWTDRVAATALLENAMVLGKTRINGNPVGDEILKYAPGNKILNFLAQVTPGDLENLPINKSVEDAIIDFGKKYGFKDLFYNTRFDGPVFKRLIDLYPRAMNPEERLASMLGINPLNKSRTELIEGILVKLSNVEEALKTLQSYNKSIYNLHIYQLIEDYGKELSSIRQDIVKTLVNSLPSNYFGEYDNQLIKKYGKKLYPEEIKLARLLDIELTENSTRKDIITRMIDKIKDKEAIKNKLELVGITGKDKINLDDFVNKAWVNLARRYNIPEQAVATAYSKTQGYKTPVELPLEPTRLRRPATTNKPAEPVASNASTGSTQSATTNKPAEPVASNAPTAEPITTKNPASEVIVNRQTTESVLPQKLSGPVASETSAEALNKGTAFAEGASAGKQPIYLKGLNATRQYIKQTVAPTVRRVGKELLDPIVGRYVGKTWPQKIGQGLIDAPLVLSILRDFWNLRRDYEQENINRYGPAYSTGFPTPDFK